jgi:O-succinylbenzoic acid--CoA ligase
VDLPDLRPGDLIACSDPPGPAWIDLVGRAWEAGAAVLSLDPRMPAAARARLLDLTRPTILEGARIDGDGVPPRTGLVIATSGTTGPPKAALLSRDALRRAVDLSAKRLGLAGETWGCPIPVAHIGGMLVVLRGLLLGVGVSFEPDPARSPATWSSIVPTQVRRLVDAGAPLIGRAFLVGGDRLDPGVRAAAEALGARIVATYGMTETCGGVVYDGVPLDEIDVAFEQEGRIVIDGPTLFDGYVGQPARAPGPFRTNDHGRSTIDGLIEVFGRLDEIVIVGGEKFDRQAIRGIIDLIPGVRHVQITVEPDDIYGARLVAVIEADASVTDDVIALAVREHYGPLAVPRIQRLSA